MYDPENPTFGQIHVVRKGHNDVTEKDLNNVSALVSARPASRAGNYVISTVLNENSEPCLYVLNFSEGGLGCGEYHPKI